MAEHALLSASSSERWLNCPPSARLGEGVEEEASQYAREGSFAHTLAELKLARFLGRISGAQYNIELGKLKQDPFYSDELEKFVQVYIGYAIERINAARAHTNDAVVLVEKKLDYSPWVPEGFGTGDLVIITDGTLEIVDFKFGRGVQVSVIDNSQVKLYALGAVNEFACLYELRLVRMVICQPRLDHISTEEIAASELIIWGDTVVAPRAALAWAGEGEFRSGAHCRFCRVRATCRARAEENMKLAGRDFKNPPLLTDEEMVEILSSLDELQRWANDVYVYALNRAVNENKQWPGYKLVEGRNMRRYTDETAVAEALMEAGFKEDKIYSKALLGITALEKVVGKKQFNQILGPYIEKLPGKPKLAPASDKRPAIKSTAEIDFSKEE